MPATPTVAGARTYRVIVRGTFGPLDAATRQRLLARLGEHDLMTVPPTDEGRLYFDETLRPFSFRCVVRQRPDLTDDDAALDAELRATEELAALGVPERPLRTAVTSVDDMRVRGRRP